MRGVESFHGGRLSLRLEGARGKGGEDKRYFYCPETRVLCSVIGYISNLSTIASSRSIAGSCDAEIACRLYQANGMSFTGELDGIFLVCIFDETAEKAYVFQSRSGFDLPVYYTRGEEAFLLSTSLRMLLRHSTMARELDLVAARDFLHWHALVPNRSTLLKGVSKLMPATFLVVDCRDRSVAVNECPPGDCPHLSRSEARRRLIPAIEECVEQAVGQLGERRIALTLTSGWDTNLLLHLLRRVTDKAIDAVTIDGGGARSEVASVRLILEKYKGVRHVTREVSKELNHFADLVWRFEGAVFNEGMSLRYELGNVLREENIDCVIVGSGADQVLWPQGSTRRALRTMRNAARRISGRESPEGGTRRNIGRGYGIALEDILLELNLKMHGIALNSFGVQCLYPFVDARIMQLGRALGFFHNWRKRAYVEEVKRALPPDVSGRLKKSGHVVDTPAIFAANRERLIGALKSELAGKLLSPSQVGRVAARPDEHHLLIMQLAYLKTFNDLFISGDYDSHFGDERLDAPLAEFL